MAIIESLGLAIKGTALKGLTSAVGKWSYAELTKSLTFFKLLSELGIERPKDEMARLYLHSIILFAAKGKPREFIELLVLKDVQASFKREKLFDESGAFLLQLDHALHTNQNIREIKHWNEVPFEQIEEFFLIYEGLVTGVQTPVQTKLVAGNKRIEEKIDQGTASLDNITKALTELSSKLSTTGIFAEGEKDKNDPVNAEYQRQLKVILDRINSGQITRSLDELLTLKDQIWDQANGVVKFKLLTNIGVCYFRQDRPDNAHAFLVEAYQYDQESNLSLSNLVNAYMAVNDIENANKYLDILLEKHPDSVEAYVCLFKLRSDLLPISEIQKFIPEKLVENAEIIAAIGVSYKKLGNLQEAILFLEKAYQLKPDEEYIEQHLLQVYMEKYHVNFRLINIKEISADTKKELEHVLALIDSNFTKVEKTDLAELKAKVLLTRSFILDCLYRREEALETINRALTFDATNPLILKQKGIQLAFRGEFDESIEILNTIKDTTQVPDVPLFLGEVLRNARKYEQAVVVLEEYAEHLTDEYYIKQVKHILLDVYIRAGMEDKIKAYLVRYRDDTSLSDRIGLANANKALGHLDIATQLLRESCTQVDEESSFKEHFFLAEALFENSMFDEAILIYESITDLDVHSELSISLIQLYQKVGRKSDALKLMERLRMSTGAIRGITEAEIAIFQDLGDYEKAREIAYQYVAKFPKNITMQLRLNSLEIRLENFKAVDDFLDGEIEYWNLDISNFRNYVAQLLSRNKRNQAFKIVYEYRRLKNNLEAHTAYMQIVLQFPLTQDEVTEPKEVVIDCAVTLKNKSGHEYIQILENRASTDLLENEINPEHPRFKRLLGKKIGDQVHFENSSQKWTVVQILSKLKYAFHQSQLKSETIYAENSPIRSFHIDDFWDVIAKLGDSNWKKNNDILNNFYISGQATFGALANKMNKSPFELWDFLRAQKKVGIRCSPGMGDELDRFSSFLSPEKVLVLDILCLMTIHKLGVFAFLASYFSEILITPSTYDEVLDFIQESKNFMAENAVNENVERLMQDVKLYTKVVLPLSILEMNSIEKDTRDQVLGKSFYDSIILATEMNAVFCSDDFPLRGLAAQEQGLEVTWSHPLIWHLNQMGRIDDNAYQDLIITLVKLNYRHTSVSKDTLSRAFETSGYRIDADNSLVFSVLNGENSSIESAVNVACHFLVSIWANANLNMAEKDSITYFTLLSLAIDRPFYAFVIEVEKFLKNVETRLQSEYFKFVILSIKLQLSAIQGNFDITLVYRN